MFTGIIEQTGTLVSLESRGGVRRTIPLIITVTQRVRFSSSAPKSVAQRRKPSPVFAHP
jgi:riboflavin synthase alpha subunit